MSNRREFTRQYYYNNNLVDELYEDWIDEIISMPLVSDSSVLTEEVGNALRINQQLINNLYSLRRHMEMDHHTTNTVENNTQTNWDRGTQTNWNSQRTRSGQRFNLENNFVINNIGNADGVFDLFRSLLEVMIDPPVNTEMEDIKVTLPEADFSKLPHQTITECILNEFENKVCNVCIENYREGDIVVTLPCEHYFHRDCIHSWLCHEKVTCPVCRHDTRDLNLPKPKESAAEDSST